VASHSRLAGCSSSLVLSTARWSCASWMCLKKKLESASSSYKLHPLLRIMFVLAQYWHAASGIYKVSNTLTVHSFAAPQVIHTTYSYTLEDRSGMLSGLVYSISHAYARRGSAFPNPNANPPQLKRS
jgi:hypothetical protein